MNASEQGLQTDRKNRYSVIPRTLIFITSTHPEQGTLDILLLKGAPTKRLWANKYNGLGGHVEGDEDVHSSAVRELHEETGLSDVDLALRAVLNIYTGSAEDKPAGVLVFVFHGHTRQRRVRTSPEGTPEWLAVDALEEYPLVDDLYELIPRVLIDSSFVYGHYTPGPDGSMQYDFCSVAGSRQISTC